MSITFDNLTHDQKIKAASHNLLLDTTAAAFEFWDGAFHSSLVLEDRAQVLSPAPISSDPSNVTKQEESAIQAWEKANIYLFHKCG